MIKEKCIKHPQYIKHFCSKCLDECRDLIRQDTQERTLKDVFERLDNLVKLAWTKDSPNNKRYEKLKKELGAGK
jgi:hypothetical protein